MEPTDYHCMNRFCNWEVLNTRKLLDGIACPECNGDTVISRIPKKPRVGGDDAEAVYTDMDAAEVVIPIPLLTITLDDINSVPTVHYRGEEVTKKLDVSFDWKSRSEYFYKTYIRVEHWDDESQGMNTKVIQHNHPFSEDDD